MLKVLIPGLDKPYAISPCGRVFNMKNGHELMPQPRGTTVKYPAVKLPIGGKWPWRFVHLLVLEAFVGPRPEGKWAAHKDGNSWNSSLTNLEWKTMSENHMDKHRHGTMPSPSAKLTPTQARAIRRFVAKRPDVSQQAIADKYGVAQTTISSILRNKIWKEAA